MANEFTKALIRACKRRVSGYDVDFKQVIGVVADLSPLSVTDTEVCHHFAEALATLAQVQRSPWRQRLVDGVAVAMQSPDRRAEAVAALAHTEVGMLQRMGLWDDEKATTAAVVDEATSERPPTCELVPGFNDEPEEDEDDDGIDHDGDY